MADVFISYKHEDRPRIEPLVRLLEDEGLDVWWDPDLIAGDRFGDIIAEEIEAAACMIVVWSISSIGAIWIRDEATMGRDRGILVPLSLDGVLPPLGFRQLQTPDLSSWRGSRHDPRLQQIVIGVKRLVRAESENQIKPAPKPKYTHQRPGKSLSRRRAIQLGAVGLTSAAGIWFGVSMQRKTPISPTTTTTFDVMTVNEAGRLNLPEARSAEVFHVTVGKAMLQFSIIPVGKFQIGSPTTEPERQQNEGPTRDIEIRHRFALGRTTVTQAEWAAVIDVAPKPVTIELPSNPSFFPGDDLPVEMVTWQEANELCQRLSAATGLHMRLPSEAEWEYACRGQTTTPFHFGPTITPQLANYCGTGGAVRGTNNGLDISSQSYNDVTYPNGSYGAGPAGTFIGHTAPALSYPPNRFGLYQMHGNVWEHCADAGPVDYSLIPSDGSPYLGAQDTHVIRGGSWSHNPAICRAAYRDAVNSDSRGWDGRIGMRLVCELGEE